MERFVWLLTLGGLVMVAGLWLLRLDPLTQVIPQLHLIGAFLAVLGGLGLLYGIAIELDPAGIDTE